MKAQRLVAAFLIGVTPALAAAHGGGLDGYGCHNDRKAGGYHCHRGPLAGQLFSSQQEMRGQLAPAVQPFSAETRRTPSATNSSAKGSIEDRLRQLDGLRAKGLVTDTEYAQKRRAILDDL